MNQKLRLRLNKEAIKQLNGQQLQQMNGGMSLFDCPTVDFWCLSAWGMCHTDFNCGGGGGGGGGGSGEPSFTCVYINGGNK